jgi:hypothetical protein
MQMGLVLLIPVLGFLVETLDIDEHFLPVDLDPRVLALPHGRAGFPKMSMRRVDEFRIIGSFHP